MIREALISDDGVYRYSLSRTWDEKSPACVWVMLNPSTADGMQDDNTIRRCIDFAKLWDCGSIKVVNLFALRATDPTELLKAPAPEGPGNDDTIAGILATVAYRFIVVAWGATHTGNKLMQNRIKEFRETHLDMGPVTKPGQFGRQLFVRCLGTTAAGHPRHPLHVRRNVALVPWGAL